MSNRKMAILSALLVGTAALAACGPSESETAEVKTCKSLAKVMLHSPADFKVVETKIEETSEGNLIRIEVDYKGTDGVAHVSDKCWFAGYSENKPLARFSYSDTADGEYLELSDDELKTLMQQISG